MVRDVEYRRCHICWERGHIAVDCPIRDSLLYLANLAADLNNRIRRPAPIRVYRVNMLRSHYGPPRRRRYDPAPRGHDRERHRVRGRHDLPARPVPVNREPGYANRRDQHDVRGPFRDNPAAGERDDIRLTPPTATAHWQDSVVCENDDHNIRLDTSIVAPQSFSEPAIATSTTMELQPVNGNEQLVSSTSNYAPLDIEIATSDAAAISTTSE
ncbi:hypothetical protein BDV29DRAFT_36371 [Aspergillus leporis]|uniref:CCHC-type domain-containing protein n=1 Tax=Aspergillus leporis TaxID=41062 RepID=A0A5N5XCH4_9EURO|nr:hypothetical protein BDV29DRAFT_36371 [Aspergillus leporis]